MLFVFKGLQILKSIVGGSCPGMKEKRELLAIIDLVADINHEIKIPHSLCTCSPS